MKKYKAGLMKNFEGMRSPQQPFSSRFSCVSREGRAALAQVKYMIQLSVALTDFE